MLPLGGKLNACCLVAKLCLTLCDPMDCSPPGTFVHGISQARMLEWVAISFSRGSVQPGIEPRSPALQEDFLQFKPPGKPNLKGTKAQWNGATDVLELCLHFNYHITLFIHFIFWVVLCLHSIFPGRSDSKSAHNVGYPGLIPGSGRSPGEGNGNPLHYSCLENPMDWGSWRPQILDLGSQRVGHDWATSLSLSASIQTVLHTGKTTHFIYMAIDHLRDLLGPIWIMSL